MIIVQVLVQLENYEEKQKDMRKKTKYEEKDDHCAGASSAGKLESAFALCAQPLLLSPRVKLHQFFFIINHFNSDICF